MEAVALKDKVPPHNDDAERATIGALLLDSEALATVLQYLRPADFYRTSHKKIFQSIINLFQKGDVTDLITLTEDLRSRGELESCGGSAYISTLTSEVPTSANVEYYARIVQGCSVRRALLKISSEIIASAHDESLESRSIIEDAERKIFEIADKQQTGSFKTAGEVVARTIEAIEKRYHTKDNYTGQPCGFSDLDDMTSGFQDAEFIVIGARPSVGKTAFACTIAANMAIRFKIPVGFFTLEMSDMALMQRIVASEARIGSQKIRTALLTPADFHSLTDAAARIYEAPLYIEDTPNMKLLDLRAQARRMITQHGVKIIFVDYLTLITPEREGNVPRHEQIAEISRSLKALARELEIPVVALSQVRRETEGKQPTLADLRESGSIEQDADVVIFLHRDRGTDREGQDGPANNIETEVIIAKQRNGPVGMIRLAFLPEYTKFESLTRGMQ
ncbi:MAG: replicative DNA helicase [Spirochaetales bacterium]|jgi:replicative DNA helicase|nr:replicative DNA helicase [Spirochaetales bacterium]